jgi:FkbM family methyltransferase
VQPSDLYRLMEDQYFGENMHERDEIERLPELLKGVELFVDVGASLGQYTFFANKILKNGKILCLEPDPLRFRRLQELTLQWARSSTNQINPIQAAAAEGDGKVRFFVTNANTSGGLFEHDLADPDLRHSTEWTEIEVDCISLDNLLKDSTPDFVKIDVEGAEYRVVLGAREILKQGKCRFLVEIHPWGDPSVEKLPADIFRLFAQFGYDFRRVEHRWLFEKSNRPLKRFLKNKLIVIVMGNAWLKSVLKRSVLALGSLRRKTVHRRIKNSAF